MSSTYLLAWLRAFVFTQVVEAPIYRFGYGARWRDALATSAMTHPVVWFVFFGPIGLATGARYGERVVAAETFAWLAEAGYLALVSKKPNALAWAFVANAASVALGQLARWLTGYP